MVVWDPRALCACRVTRDVTPEALGPRLPRRGEQRARFNAEAATACGNHVYNPLHAETELIYFGTQLLGPQRQN